jgi:hypothetical protein
MRKLPHFVYENLRLAGFNRLEEIVEYMETFHDKPRRYRLTCIPNIGTISARHIITRLLEKNLIERSRFDK